MKNAEEYILANSECVSEDTLKLYAFDKKSGEEKRLIELHLAGCEMCSDMVEGLRMYKSEEDFEKDLSLLNEKIEGEVKIIPLRPVKRYLYLAAVLCLIFGTAVFLSRIMKESDRNERKIAESGNYERKNQQAKDTAEMEKNPAVAENNATEISEKEKPEEPLQHKNIVVENKKELVAAGKAMEEIEKESVVNLDVALEDLPSLTLAEDEKQQENDLAKTVSEGTEYNRASEPGAVDHKEETVAFVQSKKVNRDNKSKALTATGQAASESVETLKPEVSSAKAYELFLQGRYKEAAAIAERQKEDGDTISYLKAVLLKENKRKSEALFRGVQAGSVFYRASRFELGRLMKLRGAKGWEVVLKELSEGQDSTAVKSRLLLKN
jgi:hypothetical protein